MVKNETEASFNQCTMAAPHSCVDGGYFDMIARKNSDGWVWLDVTNWHTGKTRVMVLYYEP